MSSIEGKIKPVLALSGEGGNNQPPPFNVPGETLDIVGFGSMIIAVVGDISRMHGDETYLLKTQHSDNGASWEDITDKSIMLEPVMPGCFCQHIILNGLGMNTKRFVRVFLAMGGTDPHFGGGIVAILGEPSSEPVAWT